MIIILILLFSGSICLSTAEGFKCSTTPITKDTGLTGVIPAGATSQVKIPAKTNCTYSFEIPKGFALKVDTTTDYMISPGDMVLFDNFFISPPAINKVDYAMNSNVTYQIISVTGNVTFIAKYTYLDLSNYQQVIKPTGTPFNATLESNKYYTVKASNANDQVNLQCGTLHGSAISYTSFEVFLFDGNDIFNSNYVGRVPQAFGRRYEYYSTSDTLTLINLYGGPSDSLFLGNDASVVENMDTYGVYVMDANTDFNGWMELKQEINILPDAWYTVICNGCPSFSIEAMLFDTQCDYSTEKGYVEIQGMTPTQKLPPMLHYQYSTNNNDSFPQLIPSPIATFHLHNASIHFFFQSRAQQQDFVTAPGTSRSISSPQLWNPDATPAFDYTFSDSSKVCNFSIDLQTIQLENDLDVLSVEVGSVNGLTTLDKKYTKTKLENENISGLGNYLKLKYSGTNTSKVVLNFETIDPLNPAGTTSLPSDITSVSTRATRVSTVSVQSTVITSKNSPIVVTTTPLITTKPVITTTPLTTTEPVITTTPVITSTITTRQTPDTTKLMSSISTNHPTSSLTTSGSTQTTVSHPETTTKGCSSLLQARIFILFLSTLLLWL
ncbi:hypothetical protein GCK72_019507 [Caenorhabditis remanei]|uniref:CUB-like domain-containing protein n=1 Tax=Caenorhabditis remanei TaxID=31234 RepID=A0A6A5GEN7_CAERE|nr:hypothetical protein GCK72_019507 [Caenorhabditis remanei]KAF1752952.1 hypothetical protein GCK72_019507 [Caenorhabditis remanei]